MIFGYRAEQLHVLVPKLVFFGEYWSLPGGFIRQTESIDEAARRILEGRTGIKDIYLDQFRVFGAADRNNAALVGRLTELTTAETPETEWIRSNRDWLTHRFISIGYYALVDIGKVIPTRTEVDASLEWYPLEALPEMILDHRQIVSYALEALRRDFDTQLIGFNLLPEKFTMKELRLLYQAVYARPFARNNFQKKMLDLGVLERLEKQYTGASNRAPYLYRFSQPADREEN